MHALTNGSLLLVSILAITFKNFAQINHYKPLIFIGATLREKLISHHWTVNEADSCLHIKDCRLEIDKKLVMINGIYHAKYSVRNSLDEILQICKEKSR